MGEAKRKADLLARTAEEGKIWGERPIVLHMDLSTTLCMVGALQLALRHPKYGTMSGANQVRDLVLAIRDQVPADEFPAIREMISLGFHPRFDR